MDFTLIIKYALIPIILMAPFLIIYAVLMAATAKLRRKYGRRSDSTNSR